MNRVSTFFSGKIDTLIAFGVKVVLAIIVFLVGRLLIRWIRNLVKKTMNKTGAETGVVQFVDSFLRVVLYILLLFLIAAKLGVESTSVAALLASAGVAVGLALQGSLSNLAGGVLILLLKPFVVGDYIIEDTHGNEGTVKEIQIFYTKLVTIDNRIIVIPNGTLATNSLTNVTSQNMRRLDLKLPISYDADIREAKAVLKKLLDRDKSVLQNEEICVYVDELGDHGVILGMRAWVSTEDYWDTRWRLLEEMKLAMDQRGIQIPYEQITVHIADKDPGKGQKKKADEGI